MDTITEEERAHAQACYACAMHVHAKRSSSIAFSVCIGLGIAAAVYFENYWLVAGALAVSVGIHFVLIQSCIRFVNQSIGMDWDTQAILYDKYRTDTEFARDVKKLASGAQEISLKQSG